MTAARPRNRAGAGVSRSGSRTSASSADELYVAPEWAVQAWDRLLEAGQAHGIDARGYRVLDALRMEKGYRYYGTDLTALDTPDEAGLGFCVALERRATSSAARRSLAEREPARPAGGCGRSLVGERGY